MNKILFITSLLLCSLFYACQEEVPFQKDTLTVEELSHKLATMSAFENYQMVFQEESSKMLSAQESLNNKDRLWLTKVQEEFPSYTDFQANANLKTVQHFQKLSHKQNTGSFSKLHMELQKLKLALEQNYSFQEDELIKALEMSLKQNNRSKIIPPTCNQMCIISGSSIYHQSYSDCTRASDGLPGRPESVCREEARWAMGYYISGCLRGCGHSE